MNGASQQDVSRFNLRSLAKYNCGGTLAQSLRKTLWRLPREDSGWRARPQFHEDRRAAFQRSVSPRRDVVRDCFPEPCHKEYVAQKKPCGAERADKYTNVKGVEEYENRARQSYQFALEAYDEMSNLLQRTDGVRDEELCGALGDTA